MFSKPGAFISSSFLTPSLFACANANTGILYSEDNPLENRTNEELNILDDSRIKIIFFILNVNFIIINDEENENEIAKINKRVHDEELLYNIINDLRGSNELLKFYNSGKIYGKNNNEKIFLKNSKIKDLNLEKINYNIYIYIEGNIMIKLIWKLKNTKFEMKVNRFQKFHDIILKLINENDRNLNFILLQKYIH